MDHKKTSNHHGYLNRRSFLDAAGGLAGGGLAVGAVFETIRPSSAWGQRPAKETHLSSGRVVDRLKTRFSFQISVDVGTLDLGLTVLTTFEERPTGHSSSAVERAERRIRETQGEEASTRAKVDGMSVMRP